VLQELSQSSFRQAAALRRWLENVLPVLNPGRMETARQELSAMHFEEAWAGSVLHDEFMEWQQEVYRGPTRSHFAAHVSERRDRGPGMDVKPRWATIMRPSRSLRHLVGRADSKLLSETRMGSVRSLSHRANPHRTVLGHACPCCAREDDTTSHMLPVVVSDGAELPGVARPAEGLRQPQSDERNMVSQFCAIRPNRSQQGPECQDGRARQA